MDQVTSTEFQKAYTHLKKPTEVTVRGKVIARYYPIGTEPPRPEKHYPMGTLTKDTTRRADREKK